MQSLLRKKIEYQVPAYSSQTSLRFRQAEGILSLSQSNAIAVGFLNVLSSSNYHEILRVKSYASLADNWDSYGAEQVSSTAIENAVAFIKRIDQYDIQVYLTSPGPNGEVMVQLKNDAREIEFVFYPSKAKYVLFNAAGFFKQGVYADVMLDDLINWLLSNE